MHASATRFDRPTRRNTADGDGNRHTVRYRRPSRNTLERQAIRESAGGAW